MKVNKNKAMNVLATASLFILGTSVFGQTAPTVAAPTLGDLNNAANNIASTGFSIIGVLLNLLVAAAFVWVIISALGGRREKILTSIGVLALVIVINTIYRVYF